jgi:hypothetical protein
MMECWDIGMMGRRPSGRLEEKEWLGGNPLL